MKTLYFYTKTVCPLCDKAKAVCWPELAAGGWQLQPVMIDGDPLLQELYGIRIPVVKREDSEEELEWPFTPRQLRDYLS